MADPKLPLPNLAGKTVPIVEVTVGTVLYRSHNLAYGPIYFGKRMLQRFDDPKGEYGVLYAAHDRAGAFVETYLRFPAPTLIGRSDLDSGGCASVNVTRSLRLVPLHSHHLVPLAATAEVTHGSSKDYTLPWLWSRAIYEHDPAIDGIEYKSRHDDSLACVALFDRASNGLQVAAPTTSWSSNVRVLGSILDRYNVALL